MADELRQVLLHGAFLFEDLCNFRFVSDDFTIQILATRVSEFIFLLCAVYTAFNHVEAVRNLVPELIVAFENEMKKVFNNCEEHRQHRDQNETVTPNTSRNGAAGRPRLVVSKDQVEGLQELGFSWSKIASMLGVSCSTLLRRRNEFEISNYTELTDEELDRVVEDILAQAPRSGERLMIGSLRSRGLRVKRGRLRDSIMRVDPINRLLRRQRCIKRRTYNVPGANYLWHIDGNHKLIRWRFVIHGGIDGFSRAVVYLRCSTNNLATTVKDLFMNAISLFGYPLRVRCDHGTENIAVARWCLNHLGTQDRPVITGLSVHNQRIERLWLDVGRCVVSYFKDIFMYMENSGILDPDDNVDLAALEIVFTERINHNLQEFVSQWNNHPLSSQNNQSPLQLLAVSHPRHLGPQQHNVNDGDFYGVDDDGPVAELQTNNHVVVPDINFDLEDEGLAIVTNNLNLLATDGSHGIDTYLEVRNRIRALAYDNNV